MTNEMKRKFCWLPTKCADGTAWLESVYVSITGHLYINKLRVTISDYKHLELQAEIYKAKISKIPKKEKEKALNELADIVFGRDEFCK